MGFSLKSLIPKFKGKTIVGKILHDTLGGAANTVLNTVGIKTKFQPKTKVGNAAYGASSILSGVASTALDGVTGGLFSTGANIVSGLVQPKIDTPFVEEPAPVATSPVGAQFQYLEPVPSATSTVVNPVSFVKEQPPVITTASAGMPSLQLQLQPQQSAQPVTDAKPVKKKKFSIKSIWEQYGKEALESAMSAAKTSVVDSYMSTAQGKQDKQAVLKHYMQKYMWVPLVGCVVILFGVLVARRK